MLQRFAVPIGKIKIVVFDSREESPTRNQSATYILGRPDQYQLLILPPRLWYSFKGLAQTPSLLANCTDIAHQPNETETLALDTEIIPYKW